ncbi:MAG: hypothetical protein PHD32_11860 [Eubacteriales bacterium]|nr:hypothetical protein [Eubacteriales bacterium]
MIRLETQPHVPGLPLSHPEVSDEALTAQITSWYNRLCSAMQEQFERYRRNEKFLTLREWEGVPAAQPGEPRPVTPVLLSTKENLLADINEARPTVEVAAQTAGYAQAARRVEAVAKFYLEKRGFARSFEIAADNALIYGPFILEVLWDPSARGGAGDIDMKSCDARTFLADPSVQELDDSPCVIRVNRVQRGYLMSLYPARAQELTAARQRERRELPGDGAWDAEMDKTDVLDFWWREYDVSDADAPRFTINFARTCGDVLLEKRLDVYAHGHYPFALSSIFRVPGSLFGMSLFDVFADTQSVIDVLDQAVVKNALMASHPKKLVSRRAGVDRIALGDMLSEIVEADNIGADALRWQDPLPLPAQIPQMLSEKTLMLKDESGQNQFNRGEGGKGVTAASAIAYLQEAGSKRARLIISRIYQAVQTAAELLVEVMAERVSPYDVYVLTNDMGENTQVALTASDFVLPDAGRIEYAVNVRVEKETERHSTVLNELMTKLIDSGRVDPAVGFAVMNIPHKQEVLNALADTARLHAQTNPKEGENDGKQREGNA